MWALEKRAIGVKQNHWFEICLLLTLQNGCILQRHWFKKKVFPIVRSMYCHHLYSIVSSAVMNNVSNLCLIECHTFHALIIWKRFCWVAWVATTSHYILLKVFYFTACVGAVILSFCKGKLLFNFITILDVLILKIIVSSKAKSVCCLIVVFYVSYSVMIEEVLIHISDVLPCLYLLRNAICEGPCYVVFFPASCYFLLLRSRYLPNILFSDTHSLCSSIMWEIIFHIHKF
jgi:hypothetical protein